MSNFGEDRFDSDEYESEDESAAGAMQAMAVAMSKCSHVDQIALAVGLFCALAVASGMTEEAAHQHVTETWKKVEKEEADHKAAGN